MRALLAKLEAGRNLTRDEADAAMTEIMAGSLPATMIAAFLVALRAKGETVDEITGLALAMRRGAVPINVTGDLLDTCGTGGDGSNSLNISTLAAIVAAAAGARVAKHGNRAASSACGSADVLEALGVAIDPGPEVVARTIDEIGIGFLFAPRFHPAMRHAAPVRRELGIPTAFNLLGPLANPAHARFHALGVGDPARAELMVRVLDALECRRALVFHGHGGLDELSVSGPSWIWYLEEGAVRSEEFDPAAAGIRTGADADLHGGDADRNAALAREVLEGRPGTRRDVVALNAGAALVAAGLAGDLGEGFRLAETTIVSGAALHRLESWAALTREAA